MDGVEDIIQATDLQASCAAFSTFKSRHSGVNWLLCDFACPQPEDKIRHLCEVWTARRKRREAKVWKCIYTDLEFLDTTFRTLFMAHKGSLYQVVSKKFQPPMSSHFHLSNVRDTTKRLMEDDKRRPVEMTEPQTAFYLLSQADETERLVIRLSAAQYDGHSVRILGEEARAMLGVDQKLKEPEGNYSTYLYQSRTIESDKAVEYWRDLLSGAKPTEIAAQTGMPTFQDFVDGVLAHSVDTRLLDLDTSSLPSNQRDRPPISITRATVVKTAWALALAELTGQDDILFGATGWGRNAPVPFAHDVVGSCSSHVPVRARIGTFDTYAELLRDLQAQHTASMRFEILGANTIVRHCTDWPRWERLSSLLVFQGLDIDGGGQREKDGGGHISASDSVGFTEIMDPGDRADVILHVEPFGQTTRILMAFSKRRVPEAVAQAVMDAFERYLGLVSQSAARSIQLGGTASPASLLRPASRQPIQSYGSQQKEVGAQTIQRAHDLVRSAWMCVLGLDAPEFERYASGHDGFLMSWGNPASAAGLALYYQEAGLGLSTEDVLRNPSVEHQIGLTSVMLKGIQQEPDLETK